MKITTHDTAWSPKYFGILTGIFCALYIMTNAIAPKVVEVYGFSFSAGIVIFPLCTILADILTEVYGFNRTRQAIWTVLLCTLFFALVAEVAVRLPSSPFWPHQEAFQTVFQTSWRIALAGSAAWLGGELINSYILSRLKVAQKGSSMGLRFIGSSFVGQFLDTTIFTLIAFAFLMPWDQVGIIILTEWGIKLLYETFFLPLSVPLAHMMKRAEGVDHFDQQELKLL